MKLVNLWVEPRDATKEAASEYRKLESLAQKLLLDQDEVVQLTDKQIQQYRDKAAESAAEIKRQAEALMREKGIVDITNTRIGMIHGLSESEKELLAAAQDGYEVERKLIGDIEKELNTREKINDAMGITGGILAGIKEVGGEFAKAFNLDKVEEDMRKFADEQTRLNGGVSKTAVLMKGLESATKNFGKLLKDPAVIFTTIVKSALDASQSITNLQRSTGMSYTSATALNAELRATSQLSGQIQISAKKFT